MTFEKQKPKAYSYIRMSTDVQLKGDSRRRQLEKSFEYASQNGLELLEGSYLEDIGVSAFTGANVKDGKLGAFLNAVEAGKIEKGSYLLVESLDRISRQNLTKSLGIFLNIISAGINLVTLVDKRMYTAEGADQGDLFYSLVIMSRAHDESLHKSDRVGRAWANKRAGAREDCKPITKRCPAWLDLQTKQDGCFKIREERTKIIQSIYQDAASGIGSYSITRRLNEKSVPSFGKSAGWQTSSVSKILTNRAVLGEFQPHKLLDGKRRPDGEPIRGYFPQIISEQLFYRAQHGRTERRTHGAGRKGQNFSNLFSRMAKCAYCGSSMVFENKGYGSRGGKFLVCDRARRGIGCIASRWRYEEFEKSFLAFVQEIDLGQLSYDERASQKRSKTAAEIESLRGQIATLEELREKAFELYLVTDANKEYTAEKIDGYAKRLAELNTLLAQTEQELSNEAAGQSGFYEGKENIVALINRLQQAGTETYKLRAHVASAIRNLVRSIAVAPLGDPEGQLPYPRFFIVLFKDGSERGVYLDRHDPLAFQQQYIAKKNEVRFFHPETGVPNGTFCG